MIFCSRPRRHADHNCRRPRAPRCPGRRLVSPPYLGLGAHPPSARAHDRAGRRHLARRQEVGLVPAGLLPLGARALTLVTPPIPAEARRRSQRRRTAVLQQSCPAGRPPSLRRVSGTTAQQRMVVYSKRPFGGPKEVLRYLARHTHRVAISNRRLIALDDKTVTFKWKDYRIEGHERYKVMSLAISEFIRRFLIYVLRQASTASAITVCSRAASVPTISRGPASCSPCQYSRLRPSMAPAPMPTNRKHQSIPAPVAAPHDHHRDLSARLLAAVPSDRIRDRNPDRHLMIPFTHLPARIVVRRGKRSSTGYGGARPSAALAPQLTHPLLDILEPLNHYKAPAGALQHPSRFERGRSGRCPTSHPQR